MTGIDLLKHDAGLADLVTEITARIERARARSRHRRSAAHALLEDGQRLGVIEAPKGMPAFGPGAPTVLLRREP